MPGLVPGIHFRRRNGPDGDARNKSGHDGRVSRQDGKEPAGTPADALDEPAAGPPEAGYDGSDDEFHYGGERVFVGPPDTPEFKAWRERQRRREEREKQQAAACAHDKT